MISRKESFEDSVNSPGSKQSQFYKSVRSGGGLFSKGINNLNSTLNNYNQDKNEEIKYGTGRDNIHAEESSDGNEPKSFLVLGNSNTFQVKPNNYNDLNISGLPYMNSCKEIIQERPSTSDNKNGEVQKFEFKLQRPSTSKPRKKASNIHRGRTRVLSQEEYMVLQNSDKKKPRLRRTTFGPKSKFGENVQRLSFKSGTKITVIEQNEGNINIFEEKNEGGVIANEDNPVFTFDPQDNGTLSK